MYDENKEQRTKEQRTKEQGPEGTRSQELGAL
jgi:hypothetical protein